jgi:ribosomal protein L37AE/L43A
MVNLLPQCIKCGSPVTDSLEDEIEQHGKIKTGSYINGVWTCNDCIATSQGQDKKTGQEEDLSASSINRKSSINDEQDTVGVASKSDVSPNTPRSDE